MLQLQYYNSNLKNNQIDKILNNYQLKYTQMKNEIDSKLNQMLKIFLKDILTFLENIEEVAEHKRKINEFDTIKKELELAKTKIKNKINIEHKLKNECDILQQENVLLKLKIKSLNHKISNLNNINLSNSFKTISPIRNSNTLNLRNNNSMIKRINISNYMSPQNELDIKLSNSVIGESHVYNRSAFNLASPTSELSKNENTLKYVDKLTLKLNYDKKVRIKNKFYKYKNNKKINIHKFVSSNKNNKVTKDISKEKKKNNSLKRYNNKKDNIKKKAEPIIKKIISSKKKNINSSVGMRNVNSNNRYSPVNTNNSIEIPFNIDYEDLGKKINNALDNELKELQKDEENIELLLEQLNEDDNDIIDISNND
jgi:hypothetical protein